MQGRISEMTSGISSVISSSINGGKAIAGVIKSAWHSQVVQESIPAFLSHVWSGVSLRNLASPIDIYQQYPQARKIVVNYGVENTLYNPVFLLLGEQMLTRYLHSVPGVEGSYVAYGLDVIDMAAYVYLLQQSLNRKINNIIYRTALTKAATPLPIPEKNFDKPEHFHEFKPCPARCGETASTMADIMSIFESPADTVFCYSTAFAISTLSYNLESPLPLIGGMVLYPLLSLKYGRDILNAKLSSVGMCETHRQEILSANNGYCMGKGASLLASVATLQWGIDYFSGGCSSLLLYSELFDLGYTSFMLAELQINKKSLPGTKPSADIFKYMHGATEAGVKWSISTLVALCYDPKRKVTWADQMNLWRETYHSAPVSMIMKLCFGNDVLVLNKFLQRPAVKACASVYERTVKDSFNWISDLRSSRLIYYALKVSPVLPVRVISEEVEGVLLSLRSKEMDGPAEFVGDLINEIYSDKFLYKSPDVPECEMLKEKQLLALSRNEEVKAVDNEVGKANKPEVSANANTLFSAKRVSRLLMKEEDSTQPSVQERRLLSEKYHND